MATERELMASRIFLRAVLPVIRVLLEDDPKIKKRFEKVQADVQFVARDPAGDVGACLVFDNGSFTVVQGVVDKPDIAFVFGSVASMNAMFAGKPALPRIRGIFKVGLLIKVMTILLALKILMPNARPKDPAKKRLKVKMTFYMITTAMSQYNKGGDPEMAKWTSQQPERIYQITVDDEIAAYLRVKAGKTKAGRGTFTKRRPFIHLKFNGVEGAMPVVLNDVDMITAIREGYLSIEGSPEYGRDFGDFMMRIQNLIT
ncbi:hypothetical protein [Desulfosudis oleivorans]|uniref:SCP2 domain-containing protein n=1 Tax=Desulfosudis oleivorans (strain DSM 6200 / JCM 39069 / Hxd3) TaxID=96561 RepID=A8ZXH8_DESOH|nr:hypothetical protein [Desulfosudis oleivorans]ABW66936.1 hypothetical protein Dole_1129 [Desulfosudis oleivorans Hxd3]